SSLLIRSKNPRRCQAENPLKLLSEFAGPALYLPGKTYSVQSTSAVPQSQLSGLQGKWDPYASDTHTLSGIIGGLKNAAASKPGSPAIPQAEQPARQSTAVVPQTPAPSIQTIQSNSRVAARTQPHNAIVSNPPPVLSHPLQLQAFVRLLEGFH
ncbi:hypothetical protein, partial [Bradyrhizobium elkanii]